MQMEDVIRHNSSTILTINNKARYIVDILSTLGYKAYIVGGCVRDIMMNELLGASYKPKDWDICTNASPTEVINIFKNDLCLQVLETGLNHGTVTVLISDNELSQLKLGVVDSELNSTHTKEDGFEITTFRTDGTYSDGRHPDAVEFISSIEEDLMRRDFTINALAYNDLEGLVGPKSSMQDIIERNLKCVGDPYKRFNEDPLRILRGLRFCSQFGLNIDTTTYQAMASLKYKLAYISKERVMAEIIKLLFGKYLKLTLLRYNNILTQIIPEIEKMIGFNQNNPNHCYDLYEHTIHCIDSLDKESSVELRLAALLHDIGKIETYTIDENGIGHFYGHAKSSYELSEIILSDLRFPLNTIDKVGKLVLYHDSLINKSSSIRKILNKLGADLFRELILLRKADILSQSKENIQEKLDELYEIEQKYNEILENQLAFKTKDLAINGKDLINLGIKQGKEIGNILNILLELVIEDKLKNNREDLLNYTKYNLIK